MPFTSSSAEETIAVFSVLRSKQWPSLSAVEQSDRRSGAHDVAELVPADTSLASESSTLKGTMPMGHCHSLGSSSLQGRRSSVGKGRRCAAGVRRPSASGSTTHNRPQPCPGTRAFGAGLRGACQPNHFIDAAWLLEEFCVACCPTTAVLQRRSVCTHSLQTWTQDRRCLEAKLGPACRHGTWRQNCLLWRPRQQKQMLGCKQLRMRLAPGRRLAR